MITCTLIGGLNASKFGDFIKENSGGSIVINKVYDSFSRDSVELSRGMIRASKLIWLVNESTNLRGDLAVLDGLMKNPTYFRTEQIYIFGTKDDDTLEGIKMFKLLMEEHDFSSYAIYLKDEISSYSVMYRELMGVDEDNRKVTVRKKVYRATVGDTSKRGYDPEDYNKNLEPKEEDRSKLYDKTKKSAIKTETNRIIKDSAEKEVPKIDLNVINIDVKKVKYQKNIFITCGKPKAGTSTLAFYLSKFLMDRGDKINLVDISPNFGGARMALSKCKSVNKSTIVSVDNTSLLTGASYNNMKLAIYSPFKLHDRSLLTSYLKYVLSIPNRTSCDYVVVDCCIDDITEVLDICGSRTARVFVAVQDVKDELIIVKKKVNTIIKSGNEHIVFLNKSIKFDKTFLRVSEVEAKQIIPDARFTGYIDFEVEEGDFTELVKVGED